MRKPKKVKRGMIFMDKDDRQSRDGERRRLLVLDRVNPQGAGPVYARVQNTRSGKVTTIQEHRLLGDGFLLVFKPGLFKRRG